MNVLLLYALSMLAAPNANSHQEHQGHHVRPAVAPSAGILSPAQIDGLRQSRGLGYAMVAEMGGYPGPRHLLELADKLALGTEQRRIFEAQFAAMKAETRPIGEQLIADAKAIESLFASGQATAASIEEASARFSAKEGRLRAAHLRYHLGTKQHLSAEQIARYHNLRHGAKQ